MYLSPCGVKCKECPLAEKCGGTCHDLAGAPFYVKDFGLEVCPIYDCAVNKRGLETCATCDELPCQIYSDWRDPEMTDQAHLDSITERVKTLKASLVAR